MPTLSRPRNDRLTAIPIAFAVLLAGLLFLYIRRFQLLIPYVDTWHGVLQYQERIEGGASLLKFLLTTHNEHPYGIPTILFLVFGPSFSILNAWTLAFASANAVVVALAVRSATGSILAACFAVAIMLSPRHDEVYLTAIMVALPLCVLMSLVALTFCERIGRGESEGGPWRAAVGCVLFTGIASLCDAAALGLYPAAILGCLVARNRTGRVTVLVLIAMGVLWFATFFAPLLHGGGPPRQPLSDVLFGFLILCGASLFEDRTVAGILGCLVLAAFLTMILRERRSLAWRLPILIGIFSLGMIFTTAYGRGLMGGINPGRYAVFSAPLGAVILAYVLTTSRVDLGRSGLAIGVALLGLLAASYGFAIQGAIAVGHDYDDIRERGTVAILDYRTVAPDVLQEFDPWPHEQAIEQIAFLERHKLNVFRRRGAGDAVLRRRSDLALLNRVEQHPPELASSVEGLFAHAPSRFDLPTPGASVLHVGFGIRDQAWIEGTTDGICFRASSQAGAHLLWERCLDPKTVADDRGRQSADIDLPADTDTVTLETLCRETCAWGWSYWSAATPDDPK